MSRKDIQLFRNDRVSLGTDRLITGTRKLAQRVVMELLTVEGSMTYLPHRGCSFIPRCRAGKTEFDVLIAFAAARTKLRRLFKADEMSDTPPNERFANMRLDEIILGDGILTLVITVISRARTAVQVVTPPIRLE